MRIRSDYIPLSTVNKTWRGMSGYSGWLNNQPETYNRVTSSIKNLVIFLERHVKW